MVTAAATAMYSASGTQLSYALSRAVNSSGATAPPMSPASV